jgi:hypothetical protein
MNLRLGVRNAAIGAALIALMANCGAVDPYIIPPGSVAIRASGPIPVSVCYNGLKTSEKDVEELIAPHCTDPKLVSTVGNLNTCPLSLPTLATFQCQDISADLDTRRDTMNTAPAY